MFILSVEAPHHYPPSPLSAISQELKWASTIDSIMPAGDVLPALVQEIQPTSCAADPALFCNNPVCSLHTITVWFGSATKQDWKRLQRKLRTVEKMIGASLLSIQHLDISWIRKCAGNITAVQSHPWHHLSQLLLSGRSERTLYANATRLKNSNFHTGHHFDQAKQSFSLNNPLYHQMVHFLPLYFFHC